MSKMYVLLSTRYIVVTKIITLFGIVMTILQLIIDKNIKHKIHNIERNHQKHLLIVNLVLFSHTSHSG